MGESIKSRFKPTYPKKYKGDSKNIICRSSWERRFCNYCDLNENILQWGSEEFWIPYKSPVDKRVHRYFPDFYVRARTKTGGKTRLIIEVKPLKQTQTPKKQQRRTKKYLNEVRTYAVNDAKWKAAREYCKDRQMVFMILTEKELQV